MSATPAGAAGMSAAHLRVLRLASGVEALSLATLLVNLLTVHAKAITTFGGPLHGMSYLVVIGAVWMAPAAAGSGARWRAVVPGVGGLLALRRLRGRPAPPDFAPGLPPQDG
ncbi:hypothetical protein MTP10_21815 [Nonomuraea sp. 3-1Str]|uniref:hypothetical protein n=1 Tax=Nonomuraea sp. 3-1Str TaxID=2929801 RepID=UPI0028664BFA|nr:hypothetical protein [Nonomuraea sp. 3-1Str]MDR8411357.1 hypothetical protein [Nonomuraea sp. 3-1Str]